MAPAVAEQAHWFLWAMGLGAGLALVYDCLRELRRLLFCATGALLSPTSSWQGESIPGICHAVAITAEGR